MNDKIAEAFLAMAEEYTKFLPGKAEVAHFQRWCRAHAPALAARVVDIMGKANATQEVQNAGNDTGEKDGHSDNGTRRRTAGAK